MGLSVVGINGWSVLGACARARARARPPAGRGPAHHQVAGPVDGDAERVAGTSGAQVHAPDGGAGVPREVDVSSTYKMPSVAPSKVFVMLRMSVL